MKIRKSFFAMLSLTVLFAAIAYSTENAPETKKPSAFIPTAKHTFRTVLEGLEVNHQFKIQNKGDADLEIFNVRTD